MIVGSECLGLELALLYTFRVSFSAKKVPGIFNLDFSFGLQKGFQGMP